MSIFQPSVINKYLKALDKQTIHIAYTRFKAHFHDAVIQENIRSSKEEQYQEGFLNDLFVNVLGYTKNPTPNYNLTTEYKNVKDSKKADGAIVISNVVKAVIELKGTNTTDLGNVEVQAFGYKNNQPECVYVITSNFEKLRFYIDNAIEHLEFNLFTLSEKEFETLYLCLAYASIEKDIPKKIKEESISQEDKVTKELYADYSLFKRELHQNLVTLNPEYDTLVLFKKSQKLLDRFLFLFFAEDRQLLPPNSVRMILNQWQQLRDLDEYTLLFDRFKKYFGYLNTGYKGKQYDVFAYNGGLFKPDEVLDNVKIDDEVLYKHTMKLSEYDFESEVDVNILGHIFENSLNELDEVKAQLSGAVVDKTKTRRKKDGVFYTPKYITKYIVDNTVGKLCIDKKEELGIKEEEYFSDKKRNKITKQPLADKLNAYREWLLQITICDPACGSGAFLNQALNFLIDEHRTIDEMQAKLFGDSMVLSDIENTILENNLFGVDLNEESVEIAKLSLWLRTAQPNRKLNDLSNNIKCGNSLIDDPSVAGEKAFDWEKEFPQVFAPGEEVSPVVKPQKDETPDYLQLIKEKSLEAQAKAEQAIALSKEAAEISKKVYEYATKLGSVSDSDSPYGIRKGGFDVVIGNPPYVLCQPSNTDNNTLEYFKSFEVASYKIDLFHLFYERSINLLKENGKLGFITPNTYLTNKYIQRLRNFILKNTHIETLVNYNEVVFVDAGVDVATLILTKKKTFNDEIQIINFENGELKLYTTRSQQSWHNDSEQVFNIKTELEIEFNDCINLQEIGNTYFGIQAYDRKSSISDEWLSDKYLPMIDGADVYSFQYSVPNKYFNYINSNIKSGGDWNVYEKERIVIRQIGQVPIVGFCTSGILTSNTIYNLYLTDKSYSLKYVFAILNSSLIKSFWMSKYNDNKGLFPKIKGYQLKQLPIKVLSITDQQPFITKADLMLSLNKELQEVSGKFQRTIQRKFTLEELPGKLQNWYLLTYAEFIAELGKKKVKLTLSDEAEWESYFVQEADKALGIKNQLDSTDREIDQLVYALYGLTGEEIALVETK